MSEGSNKPKHGAGGIKQPPSASSGAAGNTKNGGVGGGGNGFLPEPFPIASRASNNNKSHLHDAFGENDSGVDYGPPNEFEDDGDDGDECDECDDYDGNGKANNAASKERDGEQVTAGGNFNLLLNDNGNGNGNAAAGGDGGVAAGETAGRRETDRENSSQRGMAKAAAAPPPGSIDVDDIDTEDEVTTEELEEEVGLHETTLESLTSKLTSLDAEILEEKSNSETLKGDLGELTGKRNGLQTRTENKLKLVGDLEGSLERCSERLGRALDALNENNNNEARAAAAARNNDHEAQRQRQPLPERTTNDDGEKKSLEEEAAAGDDDGEGRDASGEGGAEDGALAVTGMLDAADSDMDTDDDESIRNIPRQAVPDDSSAQTIKSGATATAGRMTSHADHVDTEGNPRRQPAAKENMSNTAKKVDDDAGPHKRVASPRWQPPGKKAGSNNNANFGASGGGNDDDDVPVRRAAAETLMMTATTAKPTSASQPNRAPPANNHITYASLPLDTKHDARGRPSFPSPKLARKIHDEARTLPLYFPARRTHPLAGSLLGGMDCVSLIVDVMNVTALERALERRVEEDDINKNEGVGGGGKGKGLLKERHVWGTSLDVYAHLNWKHVFAGFRRADDCAAETMMSSSESAREEEEEARSSVVDPNVILCPYEMGGTCADDRCPYQHLRKEDDGTRDAIASRSGGGREGFIRYNDFPKARLPRCFNREDFIVKKQLSNQGKEGKEIRRNASNEDGILPVQQQQQSNKRRYHCPACVDDKTYNREELKAHMKNDCGNSSTMMEVDGVPVAVQHVLRDVQEGDFDGEDAAEGSGEDMSESEEDDDDDDVSVASQKSGSSSARSEKDPAQYSDDHSIGDDGTVEDEDDDPSGEQSADDSNANCEVKNNLDYVSLPFIPESDENDDGDGRSAGDNDDPIGQEKSIFEDVFWWQQHVPPRSPSSPSKNTEGRDTVFDHLLSVFGFQRRANKANGKGGESLRYAMTLSSDPSSTQRQRQLLFSRAVDLSRLCVHMGRDSFALSAIDGIIGDYGKANLDPSNNKALELLKDASKSIRQLMHSRCSMSTFQVQVHLLLVSECLRAHHDTICGDKCTSNAKNGFCLVSMLDQMGYLNRPDKFTEKNLVPPSFDKMSRDLTARLPSSSSAEGGGSRGNGWDGFVEALRLMMEKIVVLPFSHLETDEQLSFLMQCICISKSFGFLVRNNLSKESGFAPCLHFLEPIWSSLQLLLQQSQSLWSNDTCNGRWLHPDIVALVIIGPVLFGCVADTIAPPSNSAVPLSSSQKLPPKFDARALANVTSLNNFITGILKELSRYGRRRSGKFIEPLMAPLYALTSTIGVALGSVEKARLRLEHVLNKESGGSSSNNGKLPSLYALSEMIWSQLVQIRMICPSHSVSLKLATDKAGNGPGKLTLPNETLESHLHIASRIVGNGVFLWGVKLCGDSHMDIITPCFNQTHCNEWEKVATEVFEQHPLIEAAHGEGSGGRPHSEVEFRIFNAYPELDGLKGKPSVFPESLLLLGKTLTKLCLDNCGLTGLPLSIGHHLTHLQLLHLSKNNLHELPSSISYMTCLKVLNVSHNRLSTFPNLSQGNCTSLRVIDVSNNQLASFPADLALRCHNLQSFYVDGNPASDVHPPPQKRQRK